MSKKIPVLIILVMGILPELQKMALGRVETGSMKPKLAPKHAPKAGGSGLTPAVLEVASLIKIPKNMAKAVIPHWA